MLRTAAHPVRRHPVRYLKMTKTPYPVYRQVTGRDDSFCTVVEVRFNEQIGEYDHVRYHDLFFSVSSELQYGNAEAISEELFNYHFEMAFCAIKDAVSMVQEDLPTPSTPA